MEFPRSSKLANSKFTCKPRRLQSAGRVVDVSGDDNDTISMKKTSCAQPTKSRLFIQLSIVALWVLAKDISCFVNSFNRRKHEAASLNRDVEVSPTRPSFTTPSRSKDNDPGFTKWSLAFDFLKYHELEIKNMGWSEGKFGSNNQDLRLNLDELQIKTVGDLDDSLTSNLARTASAIGQSGYDCEKVTELLKVIF